jgi:hypothetical protein
MRIQATDLVAITSRKLTDAGFLVAPATLARVGVQEYKARELGLDGGDKIVRLYRPPTEVFATAAVGSFDGAPVTLEHPAGNVDATNWRHVAVGDVRDVKVDGKHVTGTLVVRDRAAIDEIIAGKSQLSCGYSFDLDLTPGTTTDGQAYDGVQKAIAGNHVAIVDSARCGPSCRVADCGGDAHTADASKPPQLSGPALMMARMKNGGKPLRSEAAAAPKLSGRTAMMARMRNGGLLPGEVTR